MRMWNVLRAATLLGAVAAPLAASPAGTIQSYDSYKSWFVACDNTLSCVARGFTDGDQGAQIEISREAGRDGALTASIAASDRFALADIRIDGQAAGLAAPAWRLARSDDETTLTSSDLAAVQGLVRRLRNASRVTLAGKTAIPLDGFAAVMLRLDERQGRLGGVTALLKSGPAPAAAVPPAPPLPKVARHPITATLATGEAGRLIAAVRAGQKALLAKEDCDPSPTAMAPEAHALDATRALVLIPCLMGAYQGSSLAFIAPRAGGPAQRLIAPAPYLGADAAQSQVDFFTDAGFDPQDGMLTTVAKGRGLADCGMSASWIWNGDRFRLAEIALQQSCGGLHPGDWPTLFRSSQ